MLRGLHLVLNIPIPQMLTMVDHGKARGVKMAFKPNQVLILPELAAHVGLTSPEFRVRAGDCQDAIRSAQRAAELAPWKTQTWKLLAEILGRLGKVTQAADASRRAEEVQRVRDQLAEEIDRA